LRAGERAASALTLGEAATMNIAHRLRRRIAAALAFALLFAQMALAAYACPGQDGTVPLRSATMTGMPCETMMADAAVVDEQQPALCYQHCQPDAGQPAYDLTPTLAAFSADFVLLFVVEAADRHAAEQPACAQHHRLRERASPEPHSVLHCCWRI
jgi:hypothetical protein